MKCEKCGNEYPSKYYFATDKICKSCFAKLSNEEKESLKNELLIYEQENPYAGRVSFAKRFAATLIDVIIYSAINIGILAYMGYFRAAELLGKEITQAGGDPDLIQMAINDFFDSQKSTLILAQLVPLLYFSLEVLIAASLGKLILGLRIGNEDQTPADTTTLITRYLVKNLAAFIALIGLILGTFSIFMNISALVMLILLIGYFFILTQKRQGLHDKFSKTAVYRKEDLEEYNQKV